MDGHRTPQLVDQVIADADEDEVLGPEHTDVMRALAHVLLNSRPEATRRLQERLQTIAEMLVGDME
jgi:hypothetical protein